LSEKVNLEVDTTEAERKIEALRDNVEATETKLVQMGNEVEKQTEQSFNEVLGMMRASYAMVSGIAQATGGNMAAIFSSMYSVAISVIGTYQSIAAAIALTPGGQLQAALMSMSLISAIASLVATMTGQEELARRVAGLNSALHGIGSMIGVINF